VITSWAAFRLRQSPPPLIYVKVRADTVARLGQSFAHKGNHMKQNIGSIDRFVRVVLGLVLLALILVVEGNARWWGLVGLVPLITGLVGSCPLYSMMGWSSCPTSQRIAAH
jgi:sulfite exporter TauE/SafE